MRAKRARIQSQSLLSRLGGISLFGVGMSWKAPEPERVVVKDVITSLVPVHKLQAVEFVSGIVILARARPGGFG
jgi:hypothetical protein